MTKGVVAALKGNDAREEAARSGFGGSSLPTDGGDGKWVEGGGEVMAVLGRTEADPAGEWIQQLSGANPHRRCSAAAAR
ncbi:Os06g0332150 [Oryza sativa Japonica Group]|uniref:Os06g0332150 protein n=2 Tax=Oryza TaxID=4527 RepID=A0A0P0WW36_ORYSJ|nr:Os06g0332150 [Oryza sativa Japonica Group]